MNLFTPEDANAWGCHFLDSIVLAETEESESEHLLQTYVDEATFFWSFLRQLLIERKPLEAMEVGSGVGLLSLFASSEAERITSLEPESAGFGRMSTFRRVILGSWQGENLPIFKDSFLQDLPQEETFDFIYCINVLEHVPRAEELIEEIYERLKPGGTAWFVMPNYSFPYEQHFEIPIFFNKRTTEKIFADRIRNHQKSPDSVDLWAELSWPTQRGLRKFLSSRGWSYEFRKNVLSGYFERLSEPRFIERKGALYKSLRPLLKMLRPIVMALPLGVSPIIEFIVLKPGTSKNKPSNFRT